MEWISFNDRFPQEQGIYICVVNVGSVDVRRIVSLERISQKQIDRRDSKVGDWREVTHWIPSPEPPEE